MKKEKLQGEQDYQAAMILARELRNKGSITDEDYVKLERFMADRFHPILACIIEKTA